METITKSFNIFVDTALGDEYDGSTGNNYMLNFNNLAIDAPEDAFFRLSLVDFCMLKSFTNVNTHNSKFILQLTNTSDVATAYELEIPHKNYATLHDLATEFYTVVGNKIIAYVNAQTAGTLDAVVLSNVNPDSSAGISGTSNNVLNATLTFNKSGSAVPINTKVKLARIQTYVKLPSGSYSTSYQLLGSKIAKLTTDESMTTTLNLAAGQISFAGFYPALRFNEPYIYLRCSLPNPNLATTALDYYLRQSGEKSDLHHSTILARFPVDSEIVNYNGNHDYEYFIDLHQQHLTNMRFYLTMNHGEKIPQYADDQDSLGNMNFSMTLRLDIIRKIQHDKVNFGDIKNPVNPDYLLPLNSVSSNRRIK